MAGAGPPVQVGRATVGVSAFLQSLCARTQNAAKLHGIPARRDIELATRSARAALSALALLAVVAIPASAQNILYYNDYNVGTDSMSAALTALPVMYTVTTASGTGDFATRLAGGGYDLAIFFEQNSYGSGYDAAYAALATFIGGGGAAIADDWTRNAGHSAAFGAGFTGVNNQTSITVTDVDLAAGVSNPVSLYNPGWGVFSTGLNGGTSAALFGNGDSAIVVGNGGKTIFNGFLSDTFVDGATGVQLYTNEITYVLGDRVPGGPDVPEPGALAILAGMGLAGLGFVFRRSRK